MLVPGRSLGGIELGATKAQVERRWGRAYGVCRGCAAETWYFNYFAFQPRGAAVELQKGRVAAVFTLYQPLGWRTTRGLVLGDSVARVTSVYGALVRRECGGYAVLVLPGRTRDYRLLRPRRPALGVRALPARPAALPLIRAGPSTPELRRRRA